MTRQNVTGAIKSAMEMLCVDSRQFSGKSMRRGGPISSNYPIYACALRRDRRRLGPARRRGARQSTSRHHPHTVLGEGEGLLPLVERLGGVGRFRIDELTAPFRTAVLPAQVERGTRAGYYRYGGGSLLGSSHTMLRTWG
jgi:hypothetical protein